MQLHDLAVPFAPKPVTKRLVVYTIVDKPGTDKTFWSKIGSAWVNRDQSLNIQLDALPVNGKLHVREPLERPEAAAHPTPAAAPSR